MRIGAVQGRLWDGYLRQMKIEGDHAMNQFFIWPPMKAISRDKASLREEDAYYEKYANDFKLKAPAWVGSLWRRAWMTVGRRAAVEAAASRSGPAQRQDCCCDAA
jgi:hypothetical protein